MKILPYLFTILFLASLIACDSKDPNLTKEGDDILEHLELTQPVAKSEIHFEDIIYVPIYSDIYVNANNQNNLLSAILSIRNTSFKDTIYVSNIDYYNTEGDLVRSYIDRTIHLNPMATIDYVVEKEDDKGGSGANFIIKLAAKTTTIKPLIQAVMIGADGGNKGFAFTSDGYSIKKSKGQKLLFQ